MMTGSIKKRGAGAAAVILCAALILTFVFPVLGAASGNDYSAASFSDVQKNDWFYNSVSSVCTLGMMVGTDGGRFSPLGEVTAAEAVTLLARMYASANGDLAALEADVASKTPWYQGYYDYCVQTGLYTADDSAALYQKASDPITRAELLAVFSKLPDPFWQEINTVPDGSIPDVSANDPSAPLIYRAYRAGIFVGVDSSGTFQPNSRLSRAEIAAAVVRIVKPEERVHVSFSQKVTLYAADGTSVTVNRSDKEWYLLRGWKEQPYKGNLPSIDSLLDSAPLTPVKTGYTPLDRMVDRIFAQIHTDTMTTSEKVRACYDYLVNPAHFTYGSSPVSGAYRPIYKQNPYRSPDPSRVCKPVSVMSSDRGYYYFQISLQEHALEGYAAMYASEFLDGGYGWCDHFSCAFAVMMRRLGLYCFPLYVNSERSGWYEPHMMTVMTVGGVDFIFDPQIEQVMYLKWKENRHERFGIPLKSTGNWYRDLGDLENCRRLFCNFEYDSKKMEKVLAN